MLLRILFLSMFMFLSQDAKAYFINGDISVDNISIDTNFVGTDVIAFGALSDPSDVIIVIRGPNKNFTVRRKEKVYGMWINRKQKEFIAPVYYKAIYSKNTKEFKYDSLLRKLNIGVNNISIISSDNKSNLLPKVFENALIQYQTSENLYLESEELINFTNTFLFYKKINFPKNISRGIYTIEFYAVNNDIITGVHIVPLSIDRVGLEASIHDFSMNYPFSYGIICVFIALFLGLLAHLVFSKFRLIRI